MATVHTPTSIEETPDELRITMPVPRVGCVAIFLATWLVGWAGGELAVLSMLASIRGPFAFANAFLILWLVGWTLGGAFAAWALIMSLDGREIVTIGNGFIRRRAEAFFMGLSWRYPLDRCSNLRPTGDSDGVKGFVSFDFQGIGRVHTVRFGTGLTESSAEEISEHVWARLPDLMPDRERRQREHHATDAAVGADDADEKLVEDASTDSGAETVDTI